MAIKVLSPAKRYRHFVREKAIGYAQTRILLAGRKAEEFTEDELEIIVREEEDKIKSSIKEKGLIALLAVLGAGLFF
ncbi:MAG: hypothetical protein AAFZ92_01370 [Pseudomonadota bacterium]